MKRVGSSGFGDMTENDFATSLVEVEKNSILAVKIMNDSNVNYLRFDSQRSRK